ncbi:MAG: glycosyltransferase family 4 protein [Desulfobacteraceae bacterium]|nr:glycosyltransferase family 4 protein [Desulfobacteraceae bacterium]
MVKPLKILHITTSLSKYGGIEETIRILCSRLDKRLFQVGICSITDSPGEILNEFKEMKAEIFCGSKKGRIFDIFTVLWVRKVIKSFQADIVHTHNNKGNFHGRLGSRFSRGVSIVSTHHDLGDLIFSKTPDMKKRIQGKFNAQSAQYENFIYSIVYPYLNIRMNQLNSKVITVSDTVRKIYTSDPDNRLFETVYAPFDETVFNNTRKGFKNKKIVLGTVGRLEMQKGHIYLLRAMAELVKVRKDIFLKIIGDGTLKKDIESFIKKNRLESHVILCGSLPHDARLYEDMDICIQPSVFEGCSITILEAMGTGIPVIASNIDGPKELIIPGKTGILVPPKHPDALKDVVLDLIENKEKVLKIGNAGNLRALEKFSSKVFIDKMSQIYQGLATVKEN